METMVAAINDNSEGTEKKKATVRIVIADDHPIVRDGLKKLLQLEDDFEVIGEAADGREVLERVQELDPDVLLLDLRMPNLDGLSALQALQQTNKRTRVIILTASEDKNEIVQLVAQGYKNKEMAEKMFISEQTVKNHLHNIFDKLGVSDRLELALYAIHNNLHTGR